MLTQFKIRVLLHIVALVVLVILSFYLISVRNILPFAAVLAIALIVTIISLFRLVNRTNDRLASFLMSIKYDDFNVTYSNTSDERSEKALFGAFNLINGKFRDIRLEKEMQFQYFQTLVEQVETGLIGFDEAGQTIFMNRALKQLLHKSYFATMEAVRRFDSDLHEKLSELKPGDRALLRRQHMSETLELAVRKTELKLKGSVFTFYSFQNIHAELQEQEVQSWQKLIRILTHEIMNSVSPVVSLAHATNDLLDKGEPVNDEIRAEVHSAIQAIQKRGEGLMHFTQTYRKLTKLPAPQLREVNLVELAGRVALLMKPSIEAAGVRLIEAYAVPTMLCQADPELLEQALINLLKNAVEALEGISDPEVKLMLEHTDGRIVLRVSDNGAGISDDAMDQIFVPFFTTKRDGSGIGLSLTRQIIQSHGGSISVFSQEGQGTEFVVSLS